MQNVDKTIQFPPLSEEIPREIDEEIGQGAQLRVGDGGPNNGFGPPEHRLETKLCRDQLQAVI